MRLIRKQKTKPARFIEVASSNGTLTVNADSGVVTDNLGFHGEAPVRVDVAELKLRFGDTYAKRFSSFDILNVGYWDQYGEFTPPCKDWQQDTLNTIVSELSDLLDLKIEPKKIPDEVLWRSTPIERKDWAEHNLFR